MKVALCQLNIVWENKKENLAKAERYIEEASMNQADIIFFPEMSFTGFSMNIDLTGEENDTIEVCQRYARKYQVAIGFGWVKKVEIQGENHYSIINKTGDILADYIKIHPFSYAKEDESFKPGTEIVSFLFENYRIAVFICYDLRFPEIFQIASVASDIVIVPANWPQKRKEHWDTLLQARAIENQVYMLGINCVGEIGGIYYEGNTKIINPNGEIKESLSLKEGNIYCSIEEKAEVFRKDFPVKKDRKLQLYYNEYEKLVLKEN